MSIEKVIMPSKEEVQKLLDVAINMKGTVSQMQTVGELLGMKLLDEALPKSSLEPKRRFLGEHGITSANTLKEALEKLK